VLEATRAALAEGRSPLVGFRATKFNAYPELFRAAQTDPDLDAYFDAVAAAEIGHAHQRAALFDVCCLLTIQGIALVDLTPAALVHYVTEGRRHGLTLHAGGDRWRLGGLAAWNVLHAMGRFPAGTPATLRAAMLRGQRTVTELVDQYPIRNAGGGIRIEELCELTHLSIRQYRRPRSPS
jgi:hypothetical protein